MGLNVLNRIPCKFSYLVCVDVPYARCLCISFMSDCFNMAVLNFLMNLYSCDGYTEQGWDQIGSSFHEFLYCSV